MGAARQYEEQEEPAIVPSPGFVDFMLAKMDADNVSVRQIAQETGIKRSRLHNVLHRDAAKRHAIRLDEQLLILGVLGVTQLEAALANELLADVEVNNQKGITRIATMLSVLIHGLPAQIASVIDHIEGLEYDDVRKEHGLRLQATIVKIVRDQYTDIARRREFRLEISGQ